MMIPNDVREAIEAIIRAGFEGGLDAGDPELITVRAWLDAQPQTPYSHRNGETEPPTVAGLYWIDFEVIPGYAPVVVFEQPVGVYRAIEITNHRPIDAVPVSEFQARWYGPIPQPEARND